MYVCIVHNSREKIFILWSLSEFISIPDLLFLFQIRNGHLDFNDILLFHWEDYIFFSFYIFNLVTSADQFFSVKSIFCRTNLESFNQLSDSMQCMDPGTLNNSKAMSFCGRTQDTTKISWHGSFSQPPPDPESHNLCREQSQR